MTSRGLEIRVGAVVVIAGLIAVIGTMWFQKFQLTEKRYHFFVRFDEVGGLVNGDPVYVNGVEQGRVDGVQLGQNHVVVDMGVRQGVSIPDDSRIELKSVGVMGERLVAIKEGHSPRAIAPGDTLGGVLLMGLSEIMGSAGNILHDVQITTKNLRQIAEALSANGKLQEGVNDFAATSKSLRELTDNNRGRLDRAVAGFARASTLLDSLMTRHYTQVDSSLAAIGRAGGSAEEAANNLATVSADLKEITTKLNSGQGTAGRLLNDDTFIDHVETTVSHLDSLIQDLKKHPGRYVKFSLF